MRSIRLLLAVVVVAAACDSTQTDPSSGSATTAAATTTTAAATTTVDPEQACRDVADRLAGLLGDVLDELDAATFSDRTTWPEDLLELETVGVELDRESARLGCDPGALQAEALSTIAGREPRSLLSRWLLQLLLGDSP